MSTQKVKKKLIALGLNKKTAPQLIADTKSYLQGMTGNPHFPNPVPVLAQVSANLVVLEASFLAAQTRQKGTVSKMHADRKPLESSLKTLAFYVEIEANKDPEHAETIILSTGMVLRRSMQLKPKVFTVVQTKQSGEVVLNMKAIKDACYIYEMSSDPSVATGWILLGTFNTAKQKKSGLAKMSTFYFRAATVVKNVKSNWSPVISISVN
jgi:hypothetical protein